MTSNAENDAPRGLPQVLREYGQAFRGDWSSGAIDGRSVRDEMGDIARWIEAPDTYPGDTAARERLGICPAGEGHWSWLYCDDECRVIPSPVAWGDEAREGGVVLMCDEHAGTPANQWHALTEGADSE